MRDRLITVGGNAESIPLGASILNLQIVIPIVVLALVALGVLQWSVSSLSSFIATTARQEQAIPSAAAGSEYFPAQYVNQTKDTEEYIQAL